MGELFLLSLSKGAFPHFQKGAFPTLNGGTFLTFTFTSTGGLGDRQGTRVPLPIDNCLHKNCKCPGAALCIQILLRRWRQPESKNLFSMEITFLGCFHETSTLTIYDFQGGGGEYHPTCNTMKVFCTVSVMLDVI